MEKLKTVLADKILDLSTNGNNEDVKLKIDRIQRFRDFANACQTLMKKYPQIEDELIAMAESNDYDTKVASTRVDTIIRLADNQGEKESKTYATSTTIKEEKLEDSNTKSEPNTDEKLISETFIEPESAPLWQPEDTDYEEVETNEDDDTEKGYVAFEEIRVTDNETEGTDIVEIESNKELSDEELASQERKATMKKILHIVAIIIAVILVIIIVKFVLIHWKIILIILGILVAVAGVLWYIKRNR